MKVKYIIVVILIAFCIVFFFGWQTGRERAKSGSEAVIQTLNSQINYYIAQIGDDSIYIAEKEQEIRTQREAIKNSEIQKEELRKLNIRHLNELSRLKLRIDTLLEVTHDGEVTGLFDIETVDTPDNLGIKLPFSFNKTDKWLVLDGKFDKIGELSVSLKMDVPIDLWVAVKKKSKEPTIMMASKNPYIKALSISSLKFDTPKPKKYNISFVVGYGLTKNLETSPFIGVALGRSIIRF